MSILEIKNLRKEFEGAVPLKNVSFTVEKGDVISLIGPSGTGKSTLIRCINRLETPTSGKILVNGENICASDTDLSALRRKVGMVFQSFNLFGHMTIMQNIVVPQIDLLGKSAEEAREEALRQLRRVGLEGKAKTAPMSFPAVRSSEPLLPVRWRCSRRSCCLTNQPVRSTRRWYRK